MTHATRPDAVLLSLSLPWGAQPAPDASASHLLRQGVTAFAAGCRVALCCFRAAGQRAWQDGAERATAWWRRSRQAAVTLVVRQVTAHPGLASSAARLWGQGRRAVTLAAALPPTLLKRIGRVRRAHPRRFLSYVLVADAVLGIGLVALSYAAVAGRFSVAAPGGSPAHVAALDTARRSALLLKVRPLPTISLPTRTATPASPPTPTRLPPPLTATPIPILYSAWEPSLPLDGGWSGSNTCAGTYVARVGSGTFIWPVDDHYLSGKNYSARWHPALDFSAALGDPIYAADAGVAVYGGWNTQGYGNVVILDHGNGWHTLYAHLSQVHVQCGQAVEQGTTLGLAGSTGRSTGPHLHFEMRHAVWGRVNPWNYLP